MRGCPGDTYDCNQYAHFAIHRTMKCALASGGAGDKETKMASEIETGSVIDAPASASPQVEDTAATGPDVDVPKTSDSRIGARSEKVGEQADPVSASSSPARVRRPRGESGNSSLMARAAEFRAQAAEFRAEAAGLDGYQAENLKARADRADAAADRMEAAAARSGGTTTPTEVVTDPVASQATDSGDAALTSSKAGDSIELDQEEKTKVPQEKTKRDVQQKSASGDGTMSLDFADADTKGYWKPTTVDGEKAMIWDAPQSDYTKKGASNSDQVMSMMVSPTKSGVFDIHLTGFRDESVMTREEAARHDTGNDITFKVTDMDTGEVIRAPVKMLISVGDTDKKVFDKQAIYDFHSSKPPAEISLKAGGNYKFEFFGRSDGFALSNMDLKPKK